MSATPAPNRPMHQRRWVLRTGLAVAAGAAWPLARACEFHAGTLRVTHPWTRATAADATTAVLCMRIDEVSLADRLIGASTPVATGAEMGGPEPGLAVDVPIEVGSTVELDDSATHLRLTGLKHPLQTGREYPLTLTFERSGLLLARLSVDFTAMRFR
jgi:periplasmic copper chaperone A